MKRKLLFAVLTIFIIVSLVPAVLAADAPVAQIGDTPYTSLQEAFDQAAENAKTGGNNTVKLVASFSQNSAVAIKGTVILDLNGQTITGTDSTTKNFGLLDMQAGSDLTVNDSVGTGKVTLTAVNNRGWGSYSAVIANQRSKLTVNGGTFEHLGGTDMAYGIDTLTNGKGTYAETVINGGTVKSTYRALRQFLNGVEAQNILTINGGTIEGANKSVWMQDPNANANSGSLTVSETATLKGDVYLYVTPGSTEWPVSVTIPATAMDGESKVTTGNVPDKYLFEENNGSWGVAPNPAYGKQASVTSGQTVTYHETLQGAINAAGQGDTVTVVNNLVLTETVTVAADDKIILDLNGKTVSYETTESKADDMIVNKGNLTIADSSEGKNGKLSYKYSGNANTSYSYDNATIQNEGVLTIEAGTVENTTAAMSHASYAINTNAGATLNVKGGRILNLNGHAIRQVSFGTAANTVNVFGGYIEGTRAIQFQLPGSASAAVPEMALNISGGELKSNESTYNLAVYVYSNGQSAAKANVSVSGDAVINGNIALNGAATATMPEGSASVTGGTLNGDYGIFSYADADTNNAISITGGTFATDYSKIYAEDDGYVFEENSDGSYGVEPLYTVTITIPDGASIVLEDEAGNEIAAETDGSYKLPNGTYVYTVSKSGYTTKSLKLTVADADVSLEVSLSVHVPFVPSAPKYKITAEEAENGTISVSSASAAEGKEVTVTVAPEQGFTLETLTVTDANGKEIALTKVSNNEYTFSMPASKVTVAATFMEDNTMLNYFTDVFASDYYYDAVLWAVENGITNGTSETAFSPEDYCTRGQIVTFLWRAAGCPAPKSSTTAFTDVNANEYYYDAILWAVENGITNGTSETTFSPEATCTRGQTVTFLWRAAGCPAPKSSTTAFTDVDANAYYYDAVLWAVENGITNGTSETAFSPEATCTRGQIVTFLYRDLAE